MRTVMVANLKGGSGKSLVAVHLAVGLNQVAENLVMFDTDEQSTAFDWFERREDSEPVVRQVFPTRVEVAHAECLDAGVDVVVIDTPANNPEALAYAYPICDAVVVPLRPTSFDLASLVRTLRMVAPEGHTVPVELVVNGARALGHDARNAAEVCEETFGVPVMKQHIIDRVGYFRSLARGLTVFETDAKSKDAAEMGAFVDHVAGLLAGEQ